MKFDFEDKKEKLLDIIDNSNILSRILLILVRSYS